MSDTKAPVIYVLNGPNLNLLGHREPHIYGTKTLADIGADVTAHARGRGFELVFRQSNHEGALIDWIHEANAAKAAGLVINAGAYTHTSIAIMDALKALSLPVVEVHLSNPAARESFRHHSFVATAAKGSICGFGAHGYVLAIDAIAAMIS